MALLATVQDTLVLPVVLRAADIRTPQDVLTVRDDDLVKQRSDRVREPTGVITARQGAFVQLHQLVAQLRFGSDGPTRRGRQQGFAGVQQPIVCTVAEDHEERASPALRRIGDQRVRGTPSLSKPTTTLRTARESARSVVSTVAWRRFSSRGR